MKRHFKYSTGYINVDEKNIYITSTGNWSEIKMLTEKPFGQSMFDEHKYFGFYQSLAIIILFAINLFISDTSWYINAGFILLMVMLLYKTKDYFIPELGERFLIPKSKIINITPANNQLRIDFYSLDYKKDFIKLSGIKDTDELLISTNIKSITS